MPISNLRTPHVQRLINNFSGAEQEAVRAALAALDFDPHAPAYRPTREFTAHGDTSRTIEVGAGGIRVDYKFDKTWLVTIIDIYRPKLRQTLIRLKDY